MYCTFAKQCNSCKSWKYDNKELSFKGIQDNKRLLFSCKCKETVQVLITQLKFLDEFFTLKEAAQNLGITRQGINYLIKQELLQDVEIGGKRKIHYKELARFMSTRIGINDERYKFKI